MGKEKKSLTRRDFIRGTVGTTLGASMIGLNWSADEKTAPHLSQVTLVREKNVLDAWRSVNTKILEKMVDQSLMKLTGKKNIEEAWSTIIKPSDTVGLVTTSHLNATHEELISVVKKSLLKLGIPKKNIRMAQGNPNQARACTALISLPALKAHWLTGIGTVLKNYIMFSGNPSRYHRENSSKLGEIWNLPQVKGKTKLILVDALYPLCDKGPQPDPRYKWTYNGLIAGFDPVAVETICLQIILKKRETIRGESWPLSPPPLCIKAADEFYGLGTSQLKKIKLNHMGWEKDMLL